MDLFLSIAIYSVIFLWIYHRWNDRKVIRLAAKVGAHKSHMILGFGPILTPATLIKNSVDNCQKLGHNFVSYIGPFAHFFTSDPESIKDILTSKMTKNKPKLSYKGMRHALGNGIMTMPDKEWQSHRKLMDTAFKFSKIVEFLPIFHKKMPRLFEELDKCQVMENAYDVLVHCREFTMSITGETMLGRDFDKSTLNVKHYAQFITSIMEYISNIMFKAVYQIKYFLKLADITLFREQRKMLKLLGRIIDETYKYYSKEIQNDIEYLDNQDISVAKYINAAIERNILERELAISSMIHLFGASFEPNSSALYLTILMLAMHPEYQEKAYVEICKQFPDNDGGEFKITYEQITQLTYLDMFIKETMRLFPAIPMFGRLTIGGDLTLSNGIIIPERLELAIDVYNLHRNKDIWGPDADTFDPDNFLPANVEKRHPYAFMPFGKGMRFCIGMRYAEMSIRVAMAKLIKRYKFSTTAKLEDLVLQNHITLHLANHPPLTIAKRRKLYI
ncbi:probable cytochrome P450 313a4 [Musca autumnalis]|uniref:probable cytochrome P450 313a4 n=1 Tax=Musca autumnalis TaxID=221902 RepID=UPI003CE9D2F8